MEQDISKDSRERPFRKRLDGDFFDVPHVKVRFVFIGGNDLTCSDHSDSD